MQFWLKGFGHTHSSVPNVKLLHVLLLPGFQTKFEVQKHPSEHQGRDGHSFIQRMASFGCLATFHKFHESEPIHITNIKLRIHHHFTLLEIKPLPRLLRLGCQASNLKG